MTARSANLLVADSRAIAAIWLRRFGRESTFIPYGAPVASHIGADRLTASGIEAGRYVLVVARLVPENNVDLTLDAMDLLGGEDIATVVVGDANFDSAIEQRLRGLEAKGRVTWLGHVHDQELLTQLWAHSAVYVHGHSVGGTNPALLQALGAGAPTLALDTQFNAEVLPDTDFRYPHDPSILARLIKVTCDSPMRQQRMREYGQSVVRDRYSWDDVCRAYLEALEGLAAA